MTFYNLTGQEQVYSTAINTLCNRLELAAEFCLPGDAVDDDGYLTDVLALGVYSRLFPGPTSRGYRTLLHFLAATREHATAALHLSRFLVRHRVNRQDIDDFTGLFLAEAKQSLSPFLSVNIRTKAGIRVEDADTRSMFPASFYLFNMAAAELLNRAGRNRFLATQKKMVIAPACMAAPDTDICYSIQGANGRLCTGCTASCPLNRINNLCRNNGASFRFVLHSGDVFSNRIARNLADTGYGVLGIACATSLLEGGWKAIDAGLPVQCVVLNRPACTEWFTEPQPTTCHLPAVADLLSAGLAGRKEGMRVSAGCR